MIMYHIISYSKWGKRYINTGKLTSKEKPYVEEKPEQKVLVGKELISYEEDAAFNSMIDETFSEFGYNEDIFHDNDPIDSHNDENHQRFNNIVKYSMIAEIALLVLMFFGFMSWAEHTVPQNMTSNVFMFFIIFIVFTYKFLARSPKDFEKMVAKE